MRRIRIFAAAAFFAALFSVSITAQTAASKVGVINTLAFDGKEGITKFVNGMNTLEAEFAATGRELAALATKIKALETEIRDLQAKRNDPNNKVPIPPDTLNAKVGEYEKLGREYKFKEEDAKARYERREALVMGPIRQDIGNALQEFTKKNGYLLLLDAAKMENAGLLLSLDATADVTKQFIVFYNARPATTATTTTTPK